MAIANMKASMMLASQQIATKIRKDKKAATLVAQQEQMAPLADGNDLELPPDVLDDGEVLAEAPAEPAAVVEKRKAGQALQAGAEEAAGAQPKKRGRPPGAKAKAKPAAQPEEGKAKAKPKPKPGYDWASHFKILPPLPEGVVLPDGSKRRNKNGSKPGGCRQRRAKAGYPAPAGF